MARFHDIGLLILRLGAGGFMMLHGWQKLMGFSEILPQFPPMLGLPPALGLGLATGAEFFCALLVVLGIATRLASLPIAFTMLVAAFVAHAADGWGKQEFPLLFAVCFVALFFLGSGAYSLGRKLSKNYWLQ